MGFLVCDFLPLELFEVRLSGNIVCFRDNIGLIYMLKAKDICG